MTTSLAVERAYRTNDNSGLTPKDVLQTCIEEIDQGDDYNGIIVLQVKKGDGKFNLGFVAGDMRSTEMLAACEIFKHQILNVMGYSLMPEDFDYE